MDIENRLVVARGRGRGVAAGAENGKGMEWDMGLADVRSYMWNGMDKQEGPTA